MDKQEERPSSWDPLLVAGLIVVICALPFILGDQQSSLVSVEESGITSPEGDAAKQLVLASLYGVIGFLLLKHTGLSQAVRALGWPLFLLVGLCFLSALWSDLPGVVLRRSVALAGTIAVGLYAATRLSDRDMLLALLRSIGIVLVLSFAVALVFPGSGLDPEGRLRGVTAHKNGLGALAALGLLTVMVSLSDRSLQMKRGLQVAFAACCVAALVLTDSLTPVPALAFALVVLACARNAATRSTLPALLILAAGVVGVLTPFFVSELGAIASFFGRRTDFSGRLMVWMFSLEMVQTRPWLGFGYGAFWNGDGGLAFLQWGRFPVVNAHNGFVQVALDLGFTGFLLIASTLVALTARARHLVASGPTYAYGFVYAFLAFMMAGNITENRLVVTNDPFTIVLVFMIARCNLAARRARAPATREAVPLAARSTR